MLIRMKEPDYLSGDWVLSYVVQHILSCQMLSVRVRRVDEVRRMRGNIRASGLIRYKNDFPQCGVIC